MSLTKQEIKDFMSEGIAPCDLLNGVEILEPGIIGVTRMIKAKNPLEKRLVLVEKTQELIHANRDIRKPLTSRNILQEIGGGPLVKGEWVQISDLSDHKELTITGTRGFHKLKQKP